MFRPFPTPPIPYPYSSCRNNTRCRRNRRYSLFSFSLFPPFFSSLRGNSYNSCNRYSTCNSHNKYHPQPWNQHFNLLNRKTNYGNNSPNILNDINHLLLFSELNKMDLSNYSLNQLCSLSEKLNVQITYMEQAWFNNQRKIQELYTKIVLLEQVKAHIHLKQCNRSEYPPDNVNTSN